MDFEGSFDFSLTKDGVFETMSLAEAALADAEQRSQDTITTEAIVPGEVVLDTYEVEDGPFSGAMGSVWHVHHRDWDAELAMKRPRPRYFAEAGAERKARFIAECELWINLGLHPNVVSCHYVREIGGVPTIFSEWMDGGSLEDAIASSRLYDEDDAVSQERILDVAIQMARGLHYAHSHGAGLLHLDVKPANIMLTSTWEAKVSDFGLAEALSLLTESEQATTSAKGTPAYCPREQAEGQTAKPWMDAYAWALSVLQMYAGKRLWKLGSDVAENVPDYFSRCRINVPPSMQMLLVRCIAQHVGSMAEVISELERAYISVTGGPYPRPVPQAASDTVDSLNNRALSFLDLGKRDIAQALWEAALQRSPDYTYALYNSELSKLAEQGERTSDAYQLSDQLHKLHGKTLDSSAKSETYDKDLLVVRTHLASYSNFAEHFMKKALDLCPASSSERPRYERLYETIQRSWLMLPIDPQRCGNIAFDRQGDLVAVAWQALIGGDSSCLHLAVCDLKDKGALRQRRLDEWWSDQGGRFFGSLRRVYFAGDAVTLLSDGFGWASYDPETLELVAEGDNKPPFELPWDTDWPYQPLDDGLRTVLGTNDEIRWGQLWNRPPEQGRRAKVWIGALPKASEEQCCLRAEYPAQALDLGFYAICADHEGRYLLIYHKNPMAAAAAPEFYLADTTLFGRLPEYAVARAVSYRETIDAEQAKRLALMHAEDALRAEDIARALHELDEAYRLFPNDPGEDWAHLNDEAGRFAVREALRGVRTGNGTWHVSQTDAEAHELMSIGGDDALRTFVALGEGTDSETHPQLSEELWERGYRVAFERASDAKKTVTVGADDFCLPEQGFQAHAVAAYDRGRKQLYTCADGEFCVWSVGASMPTLAGAVRFGRAGADDAGDHAAPFEPFDPSRTDALWSLVPYRIVLNRQENATAALLRSRVLNPYGPDGMTDLEMVTVIDLRTMAVTHAEPSHPLTWVLFEGGRHVARSLKLVGLSDDGCLIAINHDAYGSGTAELELWDIEEPGTFTKHLAQTFDSVVGLRGDGGALLCSDRTVWADGLKTFHYKEQLLDWAYRLPANADLREQKRERARQERAQRGSAEHKDRPMWTKEQEEERERARQERAEHTRKLRERLERRRAEKEGGQRAQPAQGQPSNRATQESQAERERKAALAELQRKAREARERAERERAEQKRREQEARAEKERQIDALRRSIDEASALISEKQRELDALGFFKGREKKRLRSEIDELGQRLARNRDELGRMTSS